MEKNYYEILEINQNASPEIVKKAYQTLAKKYHPDLQEGEKKHEYEEKLKVINEAYEVLMDENKRKQYDETLRTTQANSGGVSAEEYENLYRQKEYMKHRIEDLEKQQYQQRPYPPNDFQYRNTNNMNDADRLRQANNDYLRQQQYEQQHQQYQQQQYQQQQQELERARQKAYHDAYVQDLRNRGYKIRYKKSFKEYLTIFLTIVAVIFVLWIISLIPPVHNMLVEIYESNPVIKALVDTFSSIFNPKMLN